MFNKSVVLRKTNKIRKQLNAPFSTPDFLDLKYIPSLDGWRAVAIIIVIIAHARLGLTSGTLLHNLFRPFLGEFGVRIFFILSGFLITTLLIKEHKKNGKISIFNFLIRRILRIFPVLYLYIGTVCLINYYLKLGLTLEYFIAPILYFNNFYFFPGTWLLTHTWTLGVEEQFYLIWPFFLKKIGYPLHILFLIILIIPILKYIVNLYPELNLIFLGPFLFPSFYIFFGAALSILCYKEFFKKIAVLKILKSRTIHFFAISIVVLIAYLSHKGHFNKIIFCLGDLVTAVAISVLLLNSIIYNNTIIFKVLNSKIMVHIGTISYSLYLWQQLFILPINSYPKIEPYFKFPINIILSVITATISFYFFEKPILKLKERFSSHSNFYSI